ncbi:MAG: hypothetical protein IAA96_03910 [Spirochaetes bacterium]|uniref:Uncharacterized protein n=1 Tax=Candidatus Avitreponema avistercoris TaxID=2840705 RepID=A0A9D9ELD5_9SPIR|nr:hypothetical protein [Candidatus Avitreponema avistercoris]
MMGVKERILVLAAGIAALVLAAVLVFSAVAEKKRSDGLLREAELRKSRAIPPEAFFLPDEPLGLPGVQLSRTTPPSWTEEETGRWFIPPSDADMESLRLAGEAPVHRLLESVP